MSIHYHRKDLPYFRPVWNCSWCTKRNVPCSLSGVRYYCNDCFHYDREEYGSHAIANTAKCIDSDGNGRSLKGRVHVSGHRGY